MMSIVASLPRLLGEGRSSIFKITKPFLNLNRNNWSATTV
jgi:hypothetical protein